MQSHSISASARNGKKSNRVPAVAAVKRPAESAPAEKAPSVNSRNLVNSLSKGLRVLEAFTADTFSAIDQ